MHVWLRLTAAVCSQHVVLRVALSSAFRTSTSRLGSMPQGMHLDIKREVSQRLTSRSFYTSQAVLRRGTEPRESKGIQPLRIERSKDRRGSGRNPRVGGRRREKEEEKGREEIREGSGGSRGDLSYLCFKRRSRHPAWPIYTEKHDARRVGGSFALYTSFIHLYYSLHL